MECYKEKGGTIKAKMPLQSIVDECKQSSIVLER